MYALVEIGILNALTAGALATVALLISRVVRRPAVVHALWVLVLLKLVTPPVVEIPVGLRLERLASLTEMSIPATATANLEPTPPLPSVTTTPVVVYAGNDNPQSIAKRIDDGDSAAADPAAIERRSIGLVASVLAPATMRRWVATTIPILLWVWIAGSVAWFVVQGWRIACFVRLTATARLACEDIQRQTQQLALSIGARRAPKIWILDATMSPILWAVGSRARVIFPADLLDRVDAAARATLLTHELAHFRRGDHWVRLLEFVVTGLFWWHPAIWIARREIEIAEEHCCDAWVVSQFPGQPRRYAEALLDTIDFLSEDQPRLVPVASGLGQAPFLRQRIRLIMSGVAPKSMSGTTRLAVLAAAAVLLPLGPQLFEGAIRHADAALASTRTRGLNHRAAGDSIVFPDGARAANSPDTGTAGVTAISEAVADTAIRFDEPATPAAEIGDAFTDPSTTDSVAWAIVNSPDGRFQAVAKTGGEFVLNDTFQRRSFDLSAYQISSIAFAPHRDLLAAGSSDSKVYLFDCASGDPVATFAGHQAAVGSLAISFDSRFIVSGSRDGVVKLWDIDYESEVSSRIPAQASAINCVRFSSDGRLLAIASGDWMASNGGSVVLWDLRGGTMKRRINSTSPIGAIAFGTDQLVVAQWSGKTMSWDLQSGASELAATVDKDTVSAAAFAADAQSLLLAGASGETASAATPIWFQRMDRDQDGRLAWNEFQGPRSTFRKLDVDADEMVTRDEVTALQ